MKVGSETSVNSPEMSNESNTPVQNVLDTMKFGVTRAPKANAANTRDDQQPSTSHKLRQSPMLAREFSTKSSRSVAIQVETTSTSTTDLEDDAEESIVLDIPNCLFSMAAEGKVKEIASICNAQPQRILSRDENHASILHHAAAHGKMRVMDYILADLQGRTLLDEADETEATPLMWAVESDDSHSVDFLISRGADPTICNYLGEAPIHVSVRTNSLKALGTLVKHKGVLDLSQVQKITCVTALHIAAEHDNEEAAKLLIESGAKLCVPTHQGYMPLHVASLNASKRVIKLLIEKCAAYGYTREQILSYNDKEHCSPLDCAVIGGDAETIKMCLSYGAKLNTQQAEKTTTMHMVCAQGSYSVVENMFNLAHEQASKTLSIQDKQGHTPLHKAAIYGHAAIVIYLASQGADIDAIDSDHNTPLMLAALWGNCVLVQDLVELGADLMIKNKDRRNFLHMIVLGGDDLKKIQIEGKDGKSFETCRNILHKPEIQELLDQPDLAGCTPLHYACQEGNLASLDTLMTLGVSTRLKAAGNQSPLHFAARYGRYNACRKLLNSPQGPSIINEKDIEGMTPLHYASENGHTKVVQLFLNKGAVCHRNIRGESVLHVTAANGYTKTIKILVSVNKTLLDTVDEKGNTALHHAERYTQINAVKLLLDLGASILRNAHGHTFFTRAIQTKNREVALATVLHDRWNQAMQEFFLAKNRVKVVSLLLIKHLPEVWVVAMDRCVETADCNPKSKDYWIKYEFKYLQPSVKKCIERQNSSPEIFEKKKKGAKSAERTGRDKSDDRNTTSLPALNKMVQYNRVECLRHPVSTAYLQMKWDAYGRWFYGLNLLTYILGLISLTFLICSVGYLPAYHNQIGRYNSRIPFELPGSFIMIILLTCLSGVQLIKEFVQLYQKKWKYILDVKNFVEWLLYVSCLLYVIPFYTDYPTYWQLPLGAVAILLGWFNLLLHFRRFDFTGIFVVMFLVILKTLVKVLFLASILIVAFSLSFYALMNAEADGTFSSPLLSMLSVVTMTVGELSYSSKFLAPFVDGDGATLLYPIPSLLLLVCFVIVMPILLMNLLIGLAVSDITQIQNNAEFERLSMQVRLHTEIEGKLPNKILLSVDKEELIVYPNRKCGLINKLLRLITAKNVVVPLSESTPAAITDQRINHPNREVQKQKERLREIQYTLNKQHELLQLVVQKMEIRTEDDEKDEGASPEQSHYLVSNVTTAWGGSFGTKMAATRAFKKL